MAKLNKNVLAVVQPKKTSETDLATIRAIVEEGRDLNMQIEDLEAKLKDLKAKRYSLTNDRLPSIFEMAGIDYLGLDVKGNLPAYDAELKNHFKAVLPSKEDEPERRIEALDMLFDKGAGDLTTTEVKISLQRGEETKLAKLRSFLDKANVTYTAATDVHWATLTSWVKERFQKNNPLSQAELMKLNTDKDTPGATVGKVVSLKKRKEK